MSFGVTVVTYHVGGIDLQTDLKQVHLCCQVAQRKLGSMPLALRALPGADTCMVLGERLEVLSLLSSSSSGAARLALRPLDVPPALHATPLRLADGNGCNSRYVRNWASIGFRFGSWLASGVCIPTALRSGFGSDFTARAVQTSGLESVL